MAEKRARANRTAQPDPVALDPVPGPEIVPMNDPAEDNDHGDRGFFEHLRSLPRGVLESTLVYIYRVEPRVKKTSKPAYIERVSAEGFDEDWLKEKHGGGKYRLWLNTPDKKDELQRYIDIAGPAKIYPDQVLVDGEGNPLPTTQPAAAPGTQQITHDSIAQIVREAIQAVKEKGASADEAMAQAMGVFRKAQEGSIEILTSSLKSQVAAGNGESATLQLLRELLQEMKTQRNPGDRKLDKILDAGLDRLLNPPATQQPKTLLETINELKALQELDGLGAIFGGRKEDGAWWEPLVGKLGDALSEVLKANGPQIIEAYREKLRVDAFLAQQNGRRPAAPPAAPAPTATAPPPAATTAAPSLPLPVPTAPESAAPPDYPGAPPAAQTPAAPQPPAGSEEEQVFQIIRKQITELIATCWEENDSGADAAITVKRANRALLPVLRQNFQDFNQVLKLAREEPALAEIATDPEFPEWAKEFHTEFLADES